MKKTIILSLAMVVAVAGVVIGATGAFFSDTETSTGNTFTAGAIDLTIDNECHYNGMVCEYLESDGNPPLGYYWVDDQNDPNGPVETPFVQLGMPCNCSWNFQEWQDGRPLMVMDDMKPGDWGEYTLSFHIDSNPAWACLLIDPVIDIDNTCTEPEIDAEAALGGACDKPADGELDEYFEFRMWWDLDCDNIYDPDDGEVLVAEWQDLGGDNDGIPFVLPIADNSPASLVNGPVQPGVECVGIEWQIADDENVNVIQTDQLGATFEFYVEQYRNNPNFTCFGHYAPGDALVAGDLN